MLRAGGVVAYPTDTLYGLAVDPRNDRAVGELYRIKGRLVDKAIPLIAASRVQVEARAGALGPLASALADAFWPGPLSLVIPAWPDLAPALLAGHAGVAVRVPAHDLPRLLAEALGHPVTSTSANLSGLPPTAEPEAVAELLAGTSALLLDGGLAPGGPPSTIVDTTCEQVVLIREGAIRWERVISELPAHARASGSRVSGAVE
jgi:L-threonylcarbamoyladenylate synthase